MKLIWGVVSIEFPTHPYKAFIAMVAVSVEVWEVTSLAAVALNDRAYSHLTGQKNLPEVCLYTEKICATKLFENKIFYPTSS